MEPEIVEKRYVRVPKNDWAEDEYGAALVSVAFCQQVVRLLRIDQEEDPRPQEPTRLPAGLVWTFDDATRTVTYGEGEAAVSITFKGAIQYELLKRCQGRTGVNLRDLWRPIWGDGQPEWRTIRECARQVNLKLSGSRIPYALKVDSCFVNFLEIFDSQNQGT